MEAAMELRSDHYSGRLTADLPRGTQQALFTNVLSDDTVKRMNILGLQDVNAIIEAFRTQVCGSLSIFVHEYEFHNRSQGTNESFEEFFTDLQTLRRLLQDRN